MHQKLISFHQRVTQNFFKKFSDRVFNLFLQLLVLLRTYFVPHQHPVVLDKAEHFTSCSLLFARCSLHFPRCLLLFACYFLLVARCYLLVPRLFLLVNCYFLLVARNFLLIVRYFFLITRYFLVYGML